MSKYVKGDKRDREESPKSKPPSKDVDILAKGEGTSGEDKGVGRGNSQHIAAITIGAPQVNVASKWTMKRKNAKFMVFIRRMGNIN